jgi:predicted DsbA family dithiol-disulfide isomerase
MPKTINIEMVSDFACPWCFIGKRRLKKAIEQQPDLETTLIWRPFQLNPDMPRGGRNRQDYYRNKFGDEGAKNLRETLKNAGAEEGIVFCNEPHAMAPNTLSAHVLMFWATEDENIDANALAEKIFNAHHVACENIGDHDVLVRIAGEAGMDKASVMSKLAAGDDEDKIKGQIYQSAARAISSVPFFIINDQYGISGAQPAETLASAFDQIANAEDQQD